ncbi:MAG: N-6 DNA methylase [Candidatus Methanoperedenaceae archaeon]|nr:N-6 DNA methylase [Candidatus Methanoperedenaceae archaeon]
MSTHAMACVLYGSREPLGFAELAHPRQPSRQKTLALGRMNLYIHDIKNANLAYGDTILYPKFKEGEGLKRLMWIKNGRSFAGLRGRFICSCAADSQQNES